MVKVRKRFYNKFNILLAGQANTGKSTFFSTLKQALHVKDEFHVDAFTAPLVADLDVTQRMSLLSLSPQFRNQKNTPQDIVSYSSFVIHENGEEVTLTVFDTMSLRAEQENVWSFEDADAMQPPLDKDSQPTTTLGHIMQFITKQFDIGLIEETKVSRDTKNPHSQIHVCLYFIDPFESGLQPTDVYAMKRLAQVVNVIPVMSKGDSLTTRMSTIVKDAILGDIQRYRIPVFDFPDEDETDKELLVQNETLRMMMPFSVIGMEQTSLIVNGKSLLAREYPWGTVDIENPTHCDFSLLRQVLLTTHRESLKLVVQEHYYERYRTLRLTQIVGRSDDGGDHILRQSLKPAANHPEVAEMLRQKSQVA
jgi:septin family protein